MLASCRSLIDYTQPQLACVLTRQEIVVRRLAHPQRIKRADLDEDIWVSRQRDLSRKNERSAKNKMREMCESVGTKRCVYVSSTMPVPPKRTFSPIDATEITQKVGQNSLLMPGQNTPLKNARSE